MNLIFSEVSSIWELKVSLPKTDLVREKMKTATRADGKSHGLRYTTRIMQKKTVDFRRFWVKEPRDSGEKNQTKSAASIVAHVGYTAGFVGAIPLLVLHPIVPVSSILPVLSTGGAYPGIYGEGTRAAIKGAPLLL